MIQQFYFQEYIQENLKQGFAEKFIPPRSLHHHSQKPRGRRSTKYQSTNE